MPEVAVFGMGDQSGYGDNYCEAMDELATCFEKQGATIVGHWSSDGYDHTASKSLIAELDLSSCALVLTMCILKRCHPKGLRGSRRKESVKRLIPSSKVCFVLTENSSR